MLLMPSLVKHLKSDEKEKINSLIRENQMRAVKQESNNHKQDPRNVGKASRRGTKLNTPLSAQN